MKNSLSRDTSSETERTDHGSTFSHTFQSSPSPTYRFQVHSNMNQIVQSLPDKRTTLGETIQPKSSNHDIREGDDDSRSFISSSEIMDVYSCMSYSYAPSPSWPMQLVEALTTKNWNPVPRRSSSSRKLYPRHISPTGEGDNGGSYKPRCMHLNASYDQGSLSHIQSSSSPSQQFQALPTKRKLFSNKGEGDDVSTDYFCSSDIDATNSRTQTSTSHFSLPRTMQLFQALSLNDQDSLHQSSKSSGTIVPRYEPHVGDRDEASTHSGACTNTTNSQASSFRSLVTENCSLSWTTDQASSSGAPADFPSGSQVNINFELEKLRMELRHMQGLYSIVQSEAIDASQKKCRMGDAIKHKEIKIKEEEAKERAKQEKEKCEAAKMEADCVKEYVEKVSTRSNQEETIASCEAREEHQLKNLVHQYQMFSWEEITSATNSFSDNHRIGIGSYGTVYRCSLRHTTAAVKVLHSMAAQRSRQFQQELEILSKIRHPHLLTLLGACPERGCLIYEYMENGSLEERLLRKNNTLALPWFKRYRIAQEVASALAFLHSSQPNPIVHRDLKPANILLDHNLVSKIGDVGLSKIVQPDYAALYTIYKDTSPVGTVCYMDPEYQRTGKLSPGSDVYALGMVILQLLTAKQAIALAHTVEEAVENEKFADVLDPEAGEWPFEETRELALLALKCTEIRCRDSPDLKDHILPTLEKLRVIADKACNFASSGPSQPHTLFICPLLKDVMSDPCVAADGYTYDRKAIEAWLAENDNSPVTNEPLPHKHLLPNYTFLSAIIEWKSGKH